MDLQTKKLLLLLFKITFTANYASAVSLTEVWRIGAARAGYLDLEGLNGEKLFQNLYSDFGNYVQEIETTLAKQMEAYTGNYMNSAGFLTDLYYRTLSNLNQTADNSHAFDELMYDTCTLLIETLRDFRHNEQGRIKGSSVVMYDKIAQRKVSSAVSTPERGLGDLLFHLDAILESDFNKLSAYVEEILNNAKQNVMNHYGEIMLNYNNYRALSLGAIRKILSTMQENDATISAHTSEQLMKNYIILRTQVMAL